MVKGAKNHETTTQVDGHAVTSALEVAGDDVHFPATGATVRAVPAREVNGKNTLVVAGAPRKAISRPGDTFWKGASGCKPPRIGEGAGEGEEDEDGPLKLADIEAPPDITMYCRDGDSTIALRITWEMSWSDVLDMLRMRFGRAVVFTYTNSKQICTTCDDENAFDLFCNDAERYGAMANVDIVNAVFNASNFITDAPKLKPLWSRDNMDNKGEFEGIVLSRKGSVAHASSDAMALLGEANEEGEQEEVSKKRIFPDSWPYPASHMLILGFNGLIVSLGAVAVGFLLNWNSLSGRSSHKSALE